MRQTEPNILKITENESNLCLENFQLNYIKSEHTCILFKNRQIHCDRSFFYLKYGTPAPGKFTILVDPSLLNNTTYIVCPI